MSLKNLLSLIFVILISQTLLQPSKYITQSINNRLRSQHFPQVIGMPLWQGGTINQIDARMCRNFPMMQAASIMTQQRAYSTNQTGQQNECKPDDSRPPYEMIFGLLLIGVLLEEIEQYKYPESRVYSFFSNPSVRSNPQDDSSSYLERLGREVRYRGYTDEDILNELSRRTDGAVSPETHRIVYKNLSRHNGWTVRVQPKPEINPPSKD